MAQYYTFCLALLHEYAQQNSAAFLHPLFPMAHFPCFFLELI